MDKIFKYIDNNLHGYIPISSLEQTELIRDGWNTDANQAYEDSGKYPAKSDDDFRVDVDSLRQQQ